MGILAEAFTTMYCGAPIQSSTVPRSGRSRRSVVLTTMELKILSSPRRRATLRAAAAIGCLSIREHYGFRDLEEDKAAGSAQRSAKKCS
jgi:hypothetical protein